MSSVPLPELPLSTGVSPGADPSASGGTQGAETNSQFSAVLEGEQAALDAGQDGAAQAQDQDRGEELLPETPGVSVPGESGGNALPPVATPEGIIVAEPGEEDATPAVVVQADALQMQAAVLPAPESGMTLNQLVPVTPAGSPQRLDMMASGLTQTGGRPIPVASADAALAVNEPLNSVSAAVQRAMQSDVLPVQTNTPGAQVSELPVTPVATAQFAAIQALGDDTSAPSLNLASLAATHAAGNGGGVNAAAGSTALPTTTVDVPFRQAGWDGALGERVVWMVNQKLQAAEIKLNPPQLGPIEVRINVHNDQAQVTFTAQHAHVREALEAAIPRLRDMFGSTGLNLVDVGVSHQSLAQREGGRAGHESFMPGTGANDPLDLDESVGAVAPRSVPIPGIIDLFA